jgi:hypothetical protein
MSPAWINPGFRDHRPDVRGDVSVPGRRESRPGRDDKASSTCIDSGDGEWVDMRRGGRDLVEVNFTGHSIWSTVVGDHVGHGGYLGRDDGEYRNRGRFDREAFTIYINYTGKWIEKPSDEKRTRSSRAKHISFFRRGKTKMKIIGSNPVESDFLGATGKRNLCFWRRVKSA